MSRKVGIKVLKRIIVCLLILTMMIGGVARAEGEISSAQAAVAIDSMSGTVLMGRNYNTPMGMASTTKIMTGILALEHGNLADVVTIHPSASGIEGSSIYLNPNEKVTLETLLYGLLLKSGNDAAVAIAQHISGSEAEFVKLMNNKAAELGLKNTHFENPHGLYADTHYTTAYELALIFRYCMQNPDFAKITGTSVYTEVPPEEREARVIYNANKLLGMYDYADGGKPGYTPETGRTLVASASKNGWRVITVTLNSTKEDWQEHMNMCDEVFGAYSLQKVISKGDGLGTFRVKGGEYNEVAVVTAADVYVPVRNGTNAGKKIDVQQRTLDAPVAGGQDMGHASVTFENGFSVQVPVVTSDTVEKKSKNIIVVIWEIILALFGVE